MKKRLTGPTGMKLIIAIVLWLDRLDGGEVRQSRGFSFIFNSLGANTQKLKYLSIYAECIY